MKPDCFLEVSRPDCLLTIITPPSLLLKTRWCGRFYAPMSTPVTTPTVCESTPIYKCSRDDRFKIPPPHNWRKWPLHIKKVPRVNIDTAMKIIACMATEKEQRTAYESWKLIINPPKQTTSVEKIGKCFLLENDIEIMLEAHLIEKIEEAKADGGVWMHDEPETHKKRRRYIAWPKQANEAIKIKHTELSPKLSTAEDCIKQAWKGIEQGKIIFMYDMASWYHQFALPSDCYRYCFKFHDQVYRITTIPTGCRPAAGFTHVVTTSIARYIQNEEASYIDNVRLFIHHEEMQPKLRRLRKILEVVQAATNETMRT